MRYPKNDHAQPLPDGSAVAVRRTTDLSPLPRFWPTVIGRLDAGVASRRDLSSAQSFAQPSAGGFRWARRGMVRSVYTQRHWFWRQRYRCGLFTIPYGSSTPWWRRGKVEYSAGL